jgi:cytochrome c oxidase subunit 3
MRWGEKPKGTALPDSGREEGKPRLRGGGTNDRFPYDSFGGGDDSGSNEDGRPSYRDRLMRFRLGLGLGMISILMLFVALSSAYLVRQHTVVTTGGPGFIRWQKVRVPPLLIFNTILLLASTVTLELTRRRLQRRALFAPLAGIPGIQQEKLRSLPWLAITVALGLGFLLGQVIAWRSLRQQIFFMPGSTGGSFFYLLTGIHALHLSVGLLALFFALFSELFYGKLETRCLVVDVTSWYWHFMAVLWICIYAMMRFSG